MIFIQALKRSRSFYLLFLVLCVSTILFMSTPWSFNVSVSKLYDTLQFHYSDGQSKIRVNDFCNYNKSQAVTTKPVISIHKLVTPRFLHNYRNPCWESQAGNATLMCVPHFYLAGFPKSATTDLYKRITAHPLIVFTSRKEPHYLTRQLYLLWCSTAYQPNVSSDCYVNEYAKLFFQWSARAIKKNAKSGQLPPDLIDNKGNLSTQPGHNTDHPLITLDSSASTAWDANNWEFIEENQGCSEPAFLPADILTKINPNAFIIMIMREPVQRAYSDYLYVSKDTSPEDFHQKVLLFLTFYENCLKNHSIRHCVYNVKNHENFSTRARLEIGLYQVYIRDWLARLPRERFLFLRMEDYTKNVLSTIQDVFQFLQLPQLRQEAMVEIGKKARANENKVKRKPMLPETQKLLTNLYNVYNEKLAQLLGDERFTWRDVTTAS